MQLPRYEYNKYNTYTNTTPYINIHTQNKANTKSDHIKPLITVPVTEKELKHTKTPTRRIPYLKGRHQIHIVYCTLVPILLQYLYNILYVVETRTSCRPA